jgi:hypothetical protein
VANWKYLTVSVFLGGFSIKSCKYVTISFIMFVFLCICLSSTTRKCQNVLLEIECWGALLQFIAAFKFWFRLDRQTDGYITWRSTCVSVCRSCCVGTPDMGNLEATLVAMVIWESQLAT